MYTTSVVPQRIETLINEIVLMEDDSQWETDISEIISKLGIKVVIVKDADEALQYAERGGRGFYILDIQIGARREEGINAMQRIKGESSANFVAVYSGHDRRLKKAMEWGADYIQKKSNNLTRDIYTIILEMLPSPAKSLLAELITINERAYNSFAEEDTDSPESDINYLKYKELKNNPEWLAKHTGYYIAIVNGNQEGIDKDKERLLKAMFKKFPRQPIYFTQVTPREKNVRMFSPLFLSSR